MVMSYIIVFTPFESFGGSLYFNLLLQYFHILRLPDEAAWSEPQTYQPYNIWFIASHDKILPRE
jgi:hypothetical protein